MGPDLLVATSDVVVGLFVAIPVVVVAGGVAVGLRLRGRGAEEHVPAGEVASDAPTDVELDRSADATRLATLEEAPPSTDRPGLAPAPVEEAPVEPAPPEPVEEEPAEPPTYRSRLGKARGLLSGYLGAVRSKGKIDAATWDDLEEALIRADVGVGATDALLDGLRARVKSGEIVGPDALVDALKAELVSMLTSADSSLAVPASAGVGVSGSDGTDAGDAGQNGDGEPSGRRLAVRGGQRGGQDHHGGQGGQPDVGGSGPRCCWRPATPSGPRPGSSSRMWASRADADIVRGSEGGDPSSVVFDAVQRAASQGHAVVLADTAGRLHNKVNLIEELKKIRRVADRPPGHVVEVLLVLDATTGQNGLAQAKVFLDAVDVSGVVLTKLDGTAKGGIVVAIQRELGLPVKLVGLGEGVDDLIDFDPAAFVDALF